MEAVRRTRQLPVRAVGDGGPGDLRQWKHPCDVPQERVGVPDADEPGGGVRAGVGVVG